MKKVTFIVLTITCLLFYSNVCHATLTTLNSGGDEVVYDDVNNQYWVRDLSTFQYQTYSGQLTSISNLNNGGGYFGLTDWHMATLSEMTSLWNYTDSQITTEFLPSHVFSANFIFHAGRYDEVHPDVNGNPAHYTGVIMNSEGTLSRSTAGYEDGANINPLVGAWVVATVAPEPISSTLFIVGGATLGFRRFWKKRRTT